MTSILFCQIRYLASRSDINQALVHPGTILAIFYYLYCLVPTLFFLTGTTEGAPVKWYVYSDDEIQSHLLRSLLFSVILTISICVFSYRGTEHTTVNNIDIKIKGYAVILASIFFITPNFILSILSAPVTNYYDSYSRFDHLTGILGFIVVISKRMIWGFTPVLIFVLSIYYKNEAKKYYIAIAVIAVFTIINSYGARIDALLIAIQGLCYRFLWSFKKISKLQIIAIFPVVIFAMYALRYLEIARMGLDNNMNVTMASALLAAPSEFFALMFPSIELYRITTTESIYNYSLYLKDIITLIPFIDTSNYDVMDWYWKAFMPTALVAPYTMGVLADPALLGDWWLIVEGLVIGKLASVVNNFRMSKSPYLLAAFGYLASNGVLVLKYNMLTYVDMFINNFLLGAALLWLIFTIQKSRQLYVS